MHKMNLSIQIDDIETTFLGDDTPHYRIVLHSEIAKVANVQGFDYMDYDKFVGEICFVNERDADDAADFINNIGVDYFI